MVRTPSFDKNGIKKGAWSPEEDTKLKDFILKHGVFNWRELPKHAGLQRCGKSCRLRWVNYLRPDLKHGKYTKEEEDLILQLHQQHGNKWAKIASQLSGRTDNEIKNHWHTHLKKRAGFHRPVKNPKTHKSLHHDQNNGTHKNSPASPTSLCGDHIQILESCPLSSSETEPSTLTYTTTSFDNFEMSNTSGDFDDGGLEEILNSCDLFEDMSSLLSPFDEAHAYDRDPCNVAMAPYDTTEFGIEEDFPVMTMDDLWSKPPLSEEYYNEVLISPCGNYYEDSLFNLFEESMHAGDAMTN